MEAEYGRFFLGSMQLTPLQDPFVKEQAQSTSAETASLLHRDALTSGVVPDLHFGWQEMSSSIEDSQLRTPSRASVPRSTTPIGGIGAANRCPPKLEAASQDASCSELSKSASSTAPSLAATTASIIAERWAAKPRCSPQLRTEPMMQAAIGSADRPLEQKSRYWPTPQRPPEENHDGLDNPEQLIDSARLRGQASAAAVVSLRPENLPSKPLGGRGDVPLSKGDITGMTPCGSLDGSFEHLSGEPAPWPIRGGFRPQTPVQDRHGKAKNGSSYGVPLVVSPTAELIPDEGVRINPLNAPPSVPEWRWCVSDLLTPPMAPRGRHPEDPHADLVGAVADALLKNQDGSTAYGGSFRLPFGRSQQVQLCGSFEAAGDCSQLVVGSDWECFSRDIPSEKCEVLAPNGVELPPLTPAVIPHTPVMNYRDTMQAAISTIGALTPGMTTPEVRSPRQEGTLSTSMASPAEHAAANALAPSRSTSHDPPSEEIAEALISSSKEAPVRLSLDGDPSLSQGHMCSASPPAAISRLNASGGFSDGSSPRPESVATSDSALPMEFSDIDEPPTMTVASGNERASFNDTHEIPMQLPKMGKRKCVTHCFTSDGKKELPLGLRAMVTLDMS